MIYTVTLNPTIDRTMHFPRLAMGELNRAARSRSDFSGKGVNVSVALSRFGLDSVAMGFMAGAYGRVLVAGLQAMGLTCDFVEVEGETRSNVTVIDAATGVTTKLNEPGPTITAADLAAFEERLLARLAPGDLCVMSGALPTGAPADTYARLVAAVRRHGGLAVLDTSGVAMAAGCSAAPDLVKPNAVEAGELVGAHGPERRPAPTDGGAGPDGGVVACLESIRRLGPERRAAPTGAMVGRTRRRSGVWIAAPSRTACGPYGCGLGPDGGVVACLEGIRRLGPKRVLLSLGELGGAYSDGATACLAEPPAITELSAVGAGDTFLAAGLWAWRQGLPPQEIVRWAVAGGTAAAMQDGTVIPIRAQIEQVYREVRVRTLG